jgi:murein DD-endopeptidase MepM/ murein hydrolase activator NlpD
MDENSVEIIAVAQAQIIFKRDGEFDSSCDFSTTTPKNIIVIRHSDGSVALYGHMKNGSTTSKNVGDMVTAGKYLSLVGSSKVSTKPHLCFEVYESEIHDIPTGLID